MAATSVAARALGAADQIGRLAPGLDADMAVFRGDLPRDLGCVREPALAVVQRGRMLLAPAAGAALTPGTMPRLRPAHPAA